MPSELARSSPEVTPRFRPFRVLTILQPRRACGEPRANRQPCAPSATRRKKKPAGPVDHPAGSGLWDQDSESIDAPFSRFPVTEGTRPLPRRRTPSEVSHRLSPTPGSLWTTRWSEWLSPVVAVRFTFALEENPASPRRRGADLAPARHGDAAPVACAPRRPRRAQRCLAGTPVALEAMQRAVLTLHGARS